MIIRPYADASLRRTADRIGGAACVFSLVVFAMAGCSLAKTTIRLEAGKVDYPAGPLWVEMPGTEAAPGAVVVAEAGSHRAVPAQIGPDGRLCLWLDGMKAGATRELVVEGADSSAKDVVVVDAGKPGVAAITLSGKAFTAYNYAADMPKPCLYPVIGPTGEPMTRHFPMRDVPGEAGSDRDHPHQRSLWTAHGKINGVDYWAQGPDKGVQKHVRFESTTSGPVFGQIQATIEWRTAAGERQLTEQRTYTFYRPTDEARIIDVTVTFKMTDGDVTFGDTKEGGIIALRVAPEMTEKAGKGGMIRNANGQKTMNQAWGKPAAWCDYFGPVNGKIVGFTIMDSPKNFRHPTPYHVRDYGLFTANPFGLHDFQKSRDQNLGSKTWKNGESVTFQYRVFIHRGDTDQAGVPAQYALFAEPPRTSVDRGR